MKIRLYITVILAVFLTATSILLAYTWNNCSKQEKLKSNKLSESVEFNGYNNCFSDACELINKKRIRKPKLLGTFTISYYCLENYPHICNSGDSSKTSTGAVPKENHTVAVDPNVIPYYSKLIIDGKEYSAEDCGGAIKGNRIDIAVGTHKEALKKGKHTIKVYLKRRVI